MCFIIVILQLNNDLTCSVGMDPDSRGSTPTQDNGHYPAVVTSNSSLPSMIAVPLKPSEPPPPGEGPPLLIPRPGGPPGAGQARMRCQNFDGKLLYQFFAIKVR